jgi:hypothetical protein
MRNTKLADGRYSLVASDAPVGAPGVQVEVDRDGHRLRMLGVTYPWCGHQYRGVTADGDVLIEVREVEGGALAYVRTDAFGRETGAVAPRQE